jgi:hypothetical protein
MESKSKRKSTAVDISDVSPVTSSARVGGVVLSSSPMKKSQTSPFFDGELTDGKSSLRLFRFDSTTRNLLADFKEAKQPIILENCEIKESQVNDNIEIHVSSKTEVEESTEEYEIGTLIEGNSYNLQNVAVREYNNQKFLSTWFDVSMIDGQILVKFLRTLINNPH